VLQFPEGSVRGYEELTPTTKLSLPVGPFSDGKIEAEAVEGAVIRQVWKTPNTLTETMGLLTPLREQLEGDGYTVLFECDTRECGGFDFRFKADVVEEPEMHVDLGDFRFLSASKIVGGEEEYISLLVSRSPERGFVQVTTIGVPVDTPDTIALSTKQAEATEADSENPDLASKLNLNGATVLDGLEFLKGSSDLSGNPAESLRELAAYLQANSDKTVVLVGHTDASGSLERNVALSRERAESVMSRLIETYGVDPAQLTAEGVGYLSPRASNATDEGRDLNRRVEVVLTSIE